MRKFPFSIVQLALALAGFFVASLLYFAHKHVLDLPCSAAGGGCDVVNSSHWSQIGHIPVAVFGMLGYAALAVLAICKLTSETYHARLTFGWLSVVVALMGTGYSWYLQYVAAVDIEAFCIYCRTSAIIMTAIFIVAACEQAIRARERGSLATQPVAS